MRLGELIGSKLFLRQLLYAIAVAVVLMWVALKGLDLYTQHGRTVMVPDLVGLHEADIEDALSNSHLNYVINDSVFDEYAPKGSILNQDPAPGTNVKRGRKIYLTMVAVLPEMVRVPDLTDLSLRQAISLLSSYGLKPGQLEYRPDIAQNAVLQQNFNQAPIEPGTLVARGTAIDLVLGEGLGDNLVIVPMLLGKTREEALNTLLSVTLNIGNEFFLDEETPDVMVYQQHPDPLLKREFLPAGSSVDLYYRSPKLFDFDSFLEEQLTVPVPVLFGKTPKEARNTLHEYGLEMGSEVYENNVSEADARVFKQDPEYGLGFLIKKGDTVHVWYRPFADFESEVPH